MQIALIFVIVIAVLFKIAIESTVGSIVVVRYITVSVADVGFAIDVVTIITTTGIVINIVSQIIIGVVVATAFNDFVDVLGSLLDQCFGICQDFIRFKGFLYQFDQFMYGVVTTTTIITVIAKVDFRFVIIGVEQGII